MSTQETQTKENSGMINKTIQMEPWMISEIHRQMVLHLQTENKTLSFGEAARRLISAGLGKADSSAS